VGLVDDVQAYLQSQDVIDGSTEWPSVRRNMSDNLPDQLVVFAEDGGFEPETPAPQGSMGDAALAEPAVQVRVRGEPWDGDSAEAKAAEIYDALHGLLRTDMGSQHYLRVKAQTSSPVFIGYDERGRPEFTQSFRALRAVASTS